MKQYRTVLNDPGKPAPDRSIERISMNLRDAEDWAITVLAGGNQLQGECKIQISEQAQVTIYETTEAILKVYDVPIAKELREQRKKKEP